MAWITAIAAIGGGLLASKGAKDASKDQVEATKEGTAEQRRQFDLSREDLAPYRQAGEASLIRLRQRLGISAPTAPGAGAGSSLEPQKTKEQWVAENYGPDGPGWAEFRAWMAGDIRGEAPKPPDVDAGYADYLHGYNARLNSLPGDPGAVSSNGTSGTNSPLLRRFTMADFENDPVVQASMRYGLDEGTKGVNRMFAARGMSKSGGAIKALERFASDYVGNQAGASQQRFVGDQSNEFNKLAAVSGIGQAATTTTAQLGANTANQVGNNLIGAANARGAASIAGANAYSGALNNIANNYQQRYYMDELNNNRQQQQPMYYTEMER